MPAQIAMCTTPVRMVESASSTPLHRPPVKGRDPYLKTMGLPRAFVSSNTSPFAVALCVNQGSSSHSCCQPKKCNGSQST